MTHSTVQKVMLKYSKLKNQTIFQNTEEVFDYFNNTLTPNITNGTNSNFEFSKNLTDLDDLKPFHVATAIMFVSGFMQIIMGILRLEFLTCYFSEQVMSGFVIGGCIHVFFAQISHIMGISIPKRSGAGYLYYRICDLLEHASETHLPTVAISLLAMIFLIFGKEVLTPWFADVFLFPVPYELILAIIAITATNFAQISERYKVNVVGDIPTAFPRPILPRFDFISTILLDSLIIAAISVAVHITVAKIVEQRYNYSICYRQEFYALGLSDMLSSFFPVYPVTSGFARSIIGAAVGGSTQLTTLFSILTLLSVILYIGPALAYLPRLIWLMSMLFTICFDVGEGLALAYSAINGKPPWHLLAKNDDGNYCEMKSKQLNSIDSNIYIFRLNEPLIFTSTDRFVVIYEELISYGIKVFFAAPSGNLVKMFDAINFHETIPRNAIIGYLDDAYHL
uniref:Sulfate_transp domain-containing protein n=1 Tax=Elaeophora elaphi TaxID=1147741 RepID=A0A0R3RK79_9BILA